MRVGFQGAGKLGLPVALAINSFGIDVCVTDINPDVESYLINRRIPYKEQGADQLLKNHTITWHDTIDDVVRNSDIIFMPVQTPHEERYEGTTRLPVERKDFNYDYLVSAVKSFTNAMLLNSDPSPKTLVIISTVLPGTIHREIIPIIEQDNRIKLVYNPFFIAMGTTIHDFLHPEFVLLGVDKEIPKNLIDLYNRIHYYPRLSFYQTMSIESAELTKVAYNTFITSKICIVNTLMEICHRIPGANVDEVTNALKQATDRIISTKYLTGGMGDGGGCHPRDNIAMSWLARQLNLSYDWFENLMISREKQAQFFVSLILDHWESNVKNLVIILGYEFKPETKLTIGSHALLVYNLIKENGMNVVKYTEEESPQVQDIFSKKLIIFIGCKHESFNHLFFPAGATILDPFRYIRDQAGCKIIRIGE